MTELTLVLIVYGMVQLGSLVLLPRWWRLAALPSLYVIGLIVDYFRTGGGYMGDLFLMMFAIYGAAYLSAVWIVLGLTKQARRLMQSGSYMGWAVLGLGVLMLLLLGWIVSR